VNYVIGEADFYHVLSLSLVNHGVDEPYYVLLDIFVSLVHLDESEQLSEEVLAFLTVA